MVGESYLHSLFKHHSSTSTSARDTSNSTSSCNTSSATTISKHAHQSVLCVESSKYLVCLSKSEKQQLDEKVITIATSTATTTDNTIGAGAAVGLVPRYQQLEGEQYPISRRQRDDKDTVKDVLFFTVN